MTHPTDRRKRYVLFGDGSKPSEEMKDELGRLLAERYQLPRKALIWLERGLIVRTDNKTMARLREEMPDLEVKGFRLVSRSSSGSITKLKRLAEAPG